MPTQTKPAPKTELTQRLQALIDLCQRNNLDSINLKDGDFEVSFHLKPTASPEPKPEPQPESLLDRLAAMSPDEQRQALMHYSSE